MIAFAADEPHVVAANHFLGRIEEAILFPLMTLMMAVALLVFLWGAYEFVIHATEEEGRTKGKRNMIYGIAGLLIMISAYGILKIATGTFGI